MTTKMDVAKKKCTTPKFRVSYPAVFEPKAFEGQEAKYSIVMLFEKGKVNLKPMEEVFVNAATEKWGPKEKWPKNMRNPFRDGSEKPDSAGYEGCIFVSASNKTRPGLIDGRKNPITDKEAFYPGCFAHATVIAFAYDRAGNRGVSFSLQNIQKLGDGDSLSGRKAAQDEFEAVEDDSDNAAAYDMDI